MRQPRQHPTAHSLAALAGAVLWGLVELVALARSRWSLRQRTGGDMPSRG